RHAQSSTPLPREAEREVPEDEGSAKPVGAVDQSCGSQALLFGPALVAPAPGAPPPGPRTAKGRSEQVHCLSESVLESRLSTPATGVAKLHAKAAAGGPRVREAQRPIRLQAGAPARTRAG